MQTSIKDITPKPTIAFKSSGEDEEIEGEEEWEEVEVEEEVTDEEEEA